MSWTLFFQTLVLIIVSTIGLSMMIFFWKN